jgi:sugar lactone lactonase YvrE
MGIKTVVVRDRGFTNGELSEDTLDWFAQDAAGNVWYFGEKHGRVCRQPDHEPCGSMDGRCRRSTARAS